MPFLLSWPRRLPAGGHRDDLVSLADVFGIATAARVRSRRPRYRRRCTRGMKDTGRRRYLLYPLAGACGVLLIIAAIRRGTWLDALIGVVIVVLVRSRAQ